MESEIKIKNIIQKMTLEEKASLLSGHDFWRTRAISRLGIEHMFMSDGPHGLRKQKQEGDHLGLVEGVKATCFPTSATVANSWDLSLCELIGEALGEEARVNDVNVLLGPGLNIKRNPLCGRNFEYFSEDPYLSGKLAASYIKGIQKNGTAACPKHFAANNQEYLRMTNDSVVDKRTLHEIYLTGFEIAVKEGKPKAIMSSYNKINGTYAHENHYLLTEVLKKQWGFDGIVISDWGGANNPVKSIKAGSHLEMPTTGCDSAQKIKLAVQNNEIDEKALDTCVEDLLKVVYSTKIENKPKIDYNAHHRLAQKVAEESAVLLKNDGVLPLRVGSKVAIIGDFAANPRYQGAGSSTVNPYRLDNVIDMVSDTSIDLIGFSNGYNRNGKADATLLKESQDLARKSDITIVFIGLNESDELEGRDRTHLGINENQIELVRKISDVSAKVVAVISCGSVIEMPWDKECNAVLHGYLSGQAGAKAILNILTGVVNPSGKLSETYPLKYSDCPNAFNYPGKEKTSEYREGIYVGYRYYDKINMDLKYPFGHGLSYTEFQYSDLKINNDGVTFRVKNSGNVQGTEVVQMYIGRKQEDIHRPLKELKGFNKVCVEAGLSREVNIPFDEYTFRFFDAVKDRYAIQGGEYEIFVGSSSRDIRLIETIELEGNACVAEGKDALKKYFSGCIDDVTRDEFQFLYGKQLPPQEWDRTNHLEINDSLSQMVYAKSLIARMIIKLLLYFRDRKNKKGTPDLNLYFLSNMPFRAIAKMSAGTVTMKMVEHILFIVNGHFIKGTARLLKAFIKNRKKKRRP